MSIDLAAHAARFPSMGGSELGCYFRQVLPSLPAGSSIVEIGCWLGAGTAQLALAIRELGLADKLSLHCYDFWQASGGEVVDAAAAGVSFAPGQDTLPWVRSMLEPFGIDIHFHKGAIEAARWQHGPISFHIDDAAKFPSQFNHVVHTFGPSWIPGVTRLLLMDYHLWRKKRLFRRDLRCQADFVARYGDHFQPDPQLRDGREVAFSNEAFHYTRALDFSRAPLVPTPVLSRERIPAPVWHLGKALTRPFRQRG